MAVSFPSVFTFQHLREQSILQSTSCLATDLNRDCLRSTIVQSVVDIRSSWLWSVQFAIFSLDQDSSPITHGFLASNLV